MAQRGGHAGQGGRPARPAGDETQRDDAESRLRAAENELWVAYEVTAARAVTIDRLTRERDEALAAVERLRDEVSAWRGIDWTVVMRAHRIAEACPMPRSSEDRMRRAFDALGALASAETEATDG